MISLSLVSNTWVIIINYLKQNILTFYNYSWFVFILDRFTNNCLAVIKFKRQLLERSFSFDYKQLGFYVVSWKTPYILLFADKNLFSQIQLFTWAIKVGNSQIIDLVAVIYKFYDKGIFVRCLENRINWLK